MSTPATPGAAAQLSVCFANVLRGLDVETPVSAVVSFTEALGAVGIGRRDDVYWAGRATLVRRPEDIDAYDRAFAAFFETSFRPPDAAPPAQPFDPRYRLRRERRTGGRRSAA